MLTAMIFIFGTLLAVLLIDLFPDQATYIEEILPALVALSIIYEIIKSELKKDKEIKENEEKE